MLLLSFSFCADWGFWLEIWVYKLNRVKKQLLSKYRLDSETDLCTFSQSLFTFWLASFMYVGLSYETPKKWRIYCQKPGAAGVKWSFVCFQVIKYKLCRCMKKKHKGRSNNDRGAVLSLDDVKHHVSRLLPSECVRLHSFDRSKLFSSLSLLDSLDARVVLVRGAKTQERTEWDEGKGI